MKPLYSLSSPALKDDRDGTEAPSGPDPPSQDAPLTAIAPLDPLGGDSINWGIMEFIFDGYISLSLHVCY